MFRERTWCNKLQKRMPNLSSRGEDGKYSQMFSDCQGRARLAAHKVKHIVKQDSSMQANWYEIGK